MPSVHTDDSIKLAFQYALLLIDLYLVAVHALRLKCVHIFCKDEPAVFSRYRCVFLLSLLAVFSSLVGDRS